tara:strand:- start:39 stop:257 length:219 start_codon:yes stop_codon:yes gene_type:complete
VWLNNDLSSAALKEAHYPACVGLCQIGAWGRVKESWNDGKSRSTKWYLWPLPMRWIGWDSRGSFLGRRRKVL